MDDGSGDSIILEWLVFLYGRLVGVLSLLRVCSRPVILLHFFLLSKVFPHLIIIHLMLHASIIKLLFNYTIYDCGLRSDQKYNYVA